MTSSSSERAAAREARKKARHDRRRQDFIEAARTTLREVGLTQMTLADVARRAGETETLVYYYFDSRDDLLLALAASNIIRDVEATAEAVEAAEDGADALTALVRSLVALYADDLESFKLRMWVSMRRLPEEALQAIYPRINHMIDLVDDKLRRGQEQGLVALDIDRRARAAVALTQAEGILMNHALIQGVGAESDIALARVLDEACAQAVLGVAARGE